MDPKARKDTPNVDGRTHGRAQATSYTCSPRTGNQLYKQPKHRQPVIQAAWAQATNSTRSPRTGNELYKQPEHRQPVIQAIQDPSTRYHLYRQP